MPEYVDNKIITLNSANAVQNNGTMLSNVLFKTGCILDENNSIIDTHISVINAQIPVSFYTINATNNQFKLSINNGAYTTYSIPVGNYNNYTLITALQTLLSSFTFTFNTTNGLLTIASTNSIFSLDFTIAYSCYNLLGFAKSIYNITTGNITGLYPLNLLGVKRISIKSYNLGVLNFNSIGGDVVLTTIPCDQPPFNMLSYLNQNSNDIQRINVKMINSIDILLMDENNNLLDFNNVNWTLTLLLEITRYKPDVISSFKEILQHKPIENEKIDELESETMVSEPSFNKDLESETKVSEPSFNKDLEELDFLTE